MKAKTSGLGRGLEAIFLDNTPEEVKEQGSTLLRLSDIEPNTDQPRKSFDPEALAQLADSIAVNGLLQPILVRELGNGFYRIVAGERRWRASKMAGLSEIPAIILDIDEKKAAELALIENIQRRDLNAIEEAAAYKALLEEYGMTQEEVSRVLGISRSALANTIRLLDLPEAVSNLLVSGAITAGHARTLLGLTRRADIEKAAKIVVDRALNVRATENLVKAMNRVAAQPEVDEDELLDVVPEVDYVKELERQMTADLGRKIRITNTKRCRKLELEFTDNDDLQVLVDLLCGKK
jgi:ParB family chromosome partitioning protein